MGVKGPLRILGMISDPSTGEWPKLNVAKERERINKGIDALQHAGRVDFQWVPGGSGKDLMKKLLEETGTSSISSGTAGSRTRFRRRR